LYQLKPPPDTNVPSQGHVGSSSNPPSTNGSYLYRVVAPADTEDSTFVPGGDTPRYKCGRHLYRATQPPGTSLPPRAPSFFLSPPHPTISYLIVSFLFFLILSRSHLCLHSSLLSHLSRSALQATGRVRQDSGRHAG
jgi:hypothetical protein